MDFKGLRWVGDMYQQFENMCLEEEEVMYMDTANYVDTQFQRVGAAVRRLYSDTMRDLLPRTDSPKVAASDMPRKHATHCGFCKKEIPDHKANYIKVDIQSNCNSILSANPDARLRGSNKVLSLSTEGSIVSACFGPLSIQSKHEKVQERLSTNRKEKLEDSPLTTARPITNDGEDQSNPLSCETKVTQNVAFSQMIENTCLQTLDENIDSPSTNMCSSVQKDIANSVSRSSSSSELSEISNYEIGSIENIQSEAETLEDFVQVTGFDVNQICALVDLDANWYSPQVEANINEKMKTAIEDSSESDWELV